jgi:hypothetical protein
MIKIKRVSKADPCKLCEKCEDCGYNADEPDFLQCHTFVDARKGEKINGFICVKESNGHTASFKPDSTQQWTEEQKQHRADEQRRRREKLQWEEQQKLAKLISIPDRDKQYRRIVAALGLNQKHRISELSERRGLNFEEIDFAVSQGWLASWKPGLKVDASPSLAGVAGGQLTGVVGLAIAAVNPKGEITGFQIGSDNRVKFGKYIWLSSAKKGGNGPHLPSGELPVFVWRHPEAEEITETWKIEGGLKSLIVALKLWFRYGRKDIQIIGASGANWIGSINAVEEALGQTSKVVLCPDAGSLSNSHILNNYKKITEELTNRTYSVNVAWWNQLEKGKDPDIDELENTLGFDLITPGEFFAIADKQLKLVEQQKQTADKAKQRSNEIEQLASIRQRLTHITEIPYRVVNVPHMGEVLKDLIEPGTVNIIISDTGTGKTEASKPFADQSEAFYSWHNRRSLGKKMSSDLGLNYKDHISSNSQKKKAAFCSPSAYQFPPQNLSNGGVLMFDECDQVFDFNFGSLCNKEGIRPLILATLEAHFQSAIAGNGIVLCMSADTTQKEIDYIKAVTPEGTPVRLIINKYQPKRPDINLDISPSPEGLLDLLVEKLKAGIPCFVLDDMKNGVRGCKTIAEYVRQQLKDIPDLTLEIHSDSMDDPNVQEFVELADEKSVQYRFVVTSPSIISGISLKNQRFVNGVFAFCNGILGDREIKQFLNRVRGAEDIYMWIAEEGYPPRGVNPDLVTPQEIRDYYQRNYAANSKHILSLKTDYDPMTSEWTSPHFELFVKNLSYKAMTMKHLRHFTVEHLKEIGYGIIEQKFIPSEGVKKIREKLADIWGGIDLKEAEIIAAARILSDAEMETIQHSREDMPPELKPAYLKTRMLQIFGQELIDATTFEHKSGTELSGFAAMALKNKGGRYGRHLENFYLLNQDIGEAIARDYAAEARQLKVSGERFAGDIRWNASKRKTWEFLGLPEFLKPEQWWEPKDYEQMGNTAKKYHHRVKETIGITVKNINNGQIFGEFMYQIALELEYKQADGQKWKYRRISPESWKFAQMYLAHKEAIKVKEPVPEVVAVPEIDPMVLMLIDYLPQAKTREQCEELFVTASEQQKSEAWTMLAQEEQQRISALFEIQAIQPTIFEQVLLLDPVEVSADVDIKQSQQLSTLVENPMTTSATGIAVDPPIENQQSTELVIEKLLKVSNWGELGISQAELNEIWPLLSENQRSHLWELQREYQQQLSIEQLAQEAIALQTEIKEVGFGLQHFRSYVLKAVRGGIAIARRCWGLKDECEIELNQLLFTG